MAALDGSLEAALRYAAKHSPHYRQVFAEDELATEAQSLEAFPFTSAGDLLAGARRFRAMDACTVYASSGTTGRPKYTYFSSRDHDLTMARTADALLSAGCGPNDVIAVAHGFGIWLIGTDFARAAESIGAAVLPVGKGPTADYVLDVMRAHGVTAIASSPSYMRRLAATAETLNVSLPTVKTLLLSGETISSSIRRHLADVWSATTVVSVYGSAECGTLAAERPGDTRLELCTGDFAFEVVDLHTDERLGPGEAGELILTTLVQHAMPLVRYRTGDLVRLVAIDAAGLATRVEVMGRIDEAVVLESGEKLWPHQIDDALAAVAGVDTWQASISERPSGRAWLSEQDLLTVDVVLSAGVTSQDEVLTNARVAIESCSLEMTAVAQGAVAIEVCAISGSELRGADGSKARRLMDHRRFPTVRPLS